MNDEDVDKLAGILYEAYEYGSDGWDALKVAYPALANAWRRAAEAAVKAIVVVKIEAPR
jgi:hypothetical protein